MTVELQGTAEEPDPEELMKTETQLGETCQVMREYLELIGDLNMKEAKIKDEIQQLKKTNQELIQVQQK